MALVSPDDRDVNIPMRQEQAPLYLHQVGLENGNE